MLPPPKPWATSRFRSVPKSGKSGKFGKAKFGKNLNWSKHRHVIYHFNGFFVQVKNIEVLKVLFTLNLSYLT